MGMDKHNTSRTILTLGESVTFLLFIACLHGCILAFHLRSFFPELDPKKRIGTFFCRRREG